MCVCVCYQDDDDRCDDEGNNVSNLKFSLIIDRYSGDL